MAKIRNAKPKTSSGGYTRVFNDEDLGKLIQKIQSTVITNGTELEKIIIHQSNAINNLDTFLSECNRIQKGIYLCSKNTIKKSRYRLDKHEPDLIIFEINQDSKNCYIIELKDGDNFDTKKADGEFSVLEKFKNHLGAQIQFITHFFICSFNQENKDIIVKGFKNRFTTEQVMTGEELCHLLDISYDTILKERTHDAQDNRNYFIEELVKIPFFKSKLTHEKQKLIEKDDFYNILNEEEVF